MNHAPSEMRALASEILLGLGPDYSKYAYDVSSKKEWWEALPKGGLPEEFDDADSFYKNAVASGLWKKYKDFPGDAEARKAVTRTKWLAAEQQCFRTNQRFGQYLESSDPNFGVEPQVAEFLRQLRKEVKLVLGKVPRVLRPKFGKGTTYATSGNISCAVPSKISTVPTRTAGAADFERDWRQTLWGRNMSSIPPFSAQHLSDDLALCDSINYEAFSPWPVYPPCEIVPGNRYDVVDKNRHEDRAIAIEPSLNLFYQLGVGSFLKKRLRSFGLLLTEHVDWLGRRSGRESQAYHQLLAKLASINGLMATIDLTAASDTVALAFVEWCLPTEWFILLSSLRCPSTVIDKAAHRLEKFSSMGNGFTFELETLLFFCICRVTLRMVGESSPISVFGDDIIVPTSCYRSVCASLRFCGFTPNPSKSFGTGPFRESCGGDYYGGKSVRSPNITGEPQSPADWVVIHNQLARLEDVVDPYHLGQALNICLRNIPRPLRLYGPKVFGDSVLHGSETRWKIRKRRYMSQSPLYRTSAPVDHIACIKAVPASLSYRRWDKYTEACSRIYGIEGDKVALRGDPESYTIQWVPLTAGYEAYRH